MSNLGLALTLTSLGIGALAAVFSFRAGAADISPTWARGPHPFEPVIPALAQMGRDAGLADGFDKAARMNKIAAILMGLSVAIGIVAAIIEHHFVR